MKTLTTSIHQEHKSLSFSLAQLLPLVVASARNMIAALCALLAASAVILFFVWAAGTNASIFLGAGTWGLGFIFLALALDNREPGAVPQAISGVALLSLAMLQSSISPDFVIVSGTLLAVWVAVGLFKYLSRQVW